MKCREGRTGRLEGLPQWWQVVEDEEGEGEEEGEEEEEESEVVRELLSKHSVWLGMWKKYFQ